MEEHVVDFYSGFEGMDEIIFRTEIDEKRYLVHVWEGYMDTIFSDLFNLHPWHAGNYTNMWNEGVLDEETEWEIDDIPGFLEEWSSYIGFALNDEWILAVHAAVSTLLINAQKARTQVYLKRW